MDIKKEVRLIWVVIIIHTAADFYINWGQGERFREKASNVSVNYLFERIAELEHRVPKNPEPKKDLIRREN